MLGIALLIGCLGVTRDFTQRPVARDGFDLLWRTPSIGEARRAGFAQAVNRTVRQARFVAAIPEPIAKACR